MKDSLHERGKAMEDRFFAEKDEKLLEQLRSELSAKESRDALESASGITDATVLDALIDCGITPESLTSVSLIPLVAVAWADDLMEDSEKEAILKAAATAGITSGTASYAMLESWLGARPGAELLDSWKAYISTLKSSLSEPAFVQLKGSVIGRAEDVAKSAGGFLGLGNKVSATEEKVLKELAAAFE
jgi:hypothetical protein